MFTGTHQAGVFAGTPQVPAFTRSLCWSCGNGAVWTPAESRGRGEFSGGEAPCSFSGVAYRKVQR